MDRNSINRSTLSVPTESRNESAIGTLVPKLFTDQLPTNRQVLQVLFYKTKIDLWSMDDSLRFVTNDVISIWVNSGIPIKLYSKCYNKLKDLRLKYRNLQKTEVKKKQDIEKLFSDLFNIADKEMELMD